MPKYALKQVPTSFIRFIEDWQITNALLAQYECQDIIKIDSRWTQELGLSVSVSMYKILFGQGNSTDTVYKWRQAKIWGLRSSSKETSVVTQNHKNWDYTNL